MITFNYNEHYKFISDGTWFDKGTECEVEDGDCLWFWEEDQSTRDRIKVGLPLDELNNNKSKIAGLFYGIRTKENESESKRAKIGEKYEDGECCGLDEFEVIKR